MTVHKIISVIAFPTDTIQVTSRPFEDMLTMFCLSEKELNGKNILIIPGGTCGWGEKSETLGATLTFVDPFYSDPQMLEKAPKLFEKWRTCLHGLLDKPTELFTGQFQESFEHHIVPSRQESLNSFLRHFISQPSSYIGDTLPELKEVGKKLGKEKADMALSSFLLFFYPEIDVLAAIHGLLKVAHEVRIHPLVAANGSLSPMVEVVSNALESEGYEVKIINSAYNTYQGEDPKKTMIIRNRIEL